MVTAAYLTLKREGAEHPSFKRYFNPEDYDDVTRMFARWMGFLVRTPETEELRQKEGLLYVSPLTLYYGDKPGLNTCSYSMAYKVTEFVFGIVETPNVCFCRSFF